MGTNIKGHADYLNFGDWNAICGVCGRKYKASEMIKLPAGMTGLAFGGSMWVCRRDYRPRQPQDFVRGIPDKMAPPWTQPWPANQFVAFCTPNGRTSIAGYSVSACWVAGFIDPAFDPDATT